MRTIGGLLAVLAIAILAVSLFKIFLNRIERKRAVIGVAVGAVLLVIAGMIVPPTPELKPVDKAPSPPRKADALSTERGLRSPGRPIIAIDASLMPIVNAEIRFSGTASSGDTVSLSAAATKSIAERVVGMAPRSQTPTAINIVVKNDTGPLFHYTVDVKDLAVMGESRRPAGAYMTITREAGINNSDVREAVLEYCQGASIAFCEQTLN